MSARHSAMGGKIQIFRRPNSPYWYCSASIGGQQLKASTKQEGLAQAKDFAEDWYLTLQGKHRYGGGIPKRRTGKTFREAGDQFLREYEVITQGERNANYVKSQEANLRVHLYPFFGDMIVSDILPGHIQEYRVHRMTSRVDEKTGEPKRPARTTLHHEIVTFRQVLKTANRHGWLATLPDLSTPYKSSGKITHRAWFSPKEHMALVEAIRARIANPPHNRGRWVAEYQGLLDYALIMVGTGLRPDEAARLEFRDIEVVLDDDSGETILEIEVRGKRGVGYCKSMPTAVFPYERLLKRRTPEGADAPPPTDRVFGKPPRELLNTILNELGLKHDREGQVRTSYSLRHTYISMRLMEGADIYQIAKNCRTSVEMIEKYYASHIKNMIDASAINVRRTQTNRKSRTRVSSKGERPNL